MVRAMPAKPLTDEQKADAARLMTHFTAWQRRMKDSKQPISQLEAAARMGFGQSALSQYLTGKIPLNYTVLAKICDLIGSTPELISPALVKAEAERFAAWSGFESAAEAQAAQLFELRGIAVKRLMPGAHLPSWFRSAAPGYRPDMEIVVGDESCWVEVKPLADELTRTLPPAHLESQYPDRFLFLTGAPEGYARRIDEWLQTRRGTDAMQFVDTRAQETPPRYRLKEPQRVWVVDLSRGSSTIWDEGDRPVGATEEYAEVATSDERAFACRVVGDAMVPRFMPGEFALVEPGMEPDLEDDVLVRLHSGEVLIRRLLSRRGGVRLGTYSNSDVQTFREDEIVWMYYVAHPIPARRIKHRLANQDAP
jgi:transcriptional regulator with XRE-family HTH domain